MSYDILLVPRSGGSFRSADVSATLAGQPRLRRLAWDRFQSASGLNVLLVADTATDAVDSVVFQVPLPLSGLADSFDFAFDLALLLSERLDATLLDAQTGHEVTRDSRDAVRAKAVEAATWASRLGSQSNATTGRAPSPPTTGAPLRAISSPEPARRPWWRLWGR